MKVYQESPGSTFESNGKVYDLNGILRDTANLPVNNISPANLIWCCSPEKLDPKRVQAADTNVPILVTIERSQSVVVDGEHRVTKAYVLEKRVVMPYRLVPAAIMKKHRIEVKK